MAARPSEATELLGKDFRKVSPKLRMFANGNVRVNEVRAASSPSLAAPVLMPDLALGVGLLPAAPPAAPKRRRRVQNLRRLAPGVRASVFIQTSSVSPPAGVFDNYDQRGNLILADIDLRDLPRISADPRTAFVETGQTLALPRPEVVLGSPAAPQPSLRDVPRPELHAYGADVLVGIVDVQGFDFAHQDFLDAGKTRFIRIWDQASNSRRSPHARNPKAYGSTLNYGAELTAENLNAAIASSPREKLPATVLEPQSQMSEGSHGTHVASIAAGNLGVARRAKIAGVLLGLPKTDRERRKSFYDSTRLAAAVDYLCALAAEEKCKAVAINISLGTNGHAHDASSPINRWIESAMAVTGRCVVVAAGNAGQEAPTFAGDTGYVSGRIHTSGRLAARGLDRVLDWMVPGNGYVDGSENELEIWYSAQDRFAVSVRPPQGTWIGPIEPQEFVENRQLPSGSFISIYNELYHPANGANYISVYLSPDYESTPIVGIPSGPWAVRLHAREVRNGQFHAWVERDDPRPIGVPAQPELYALPSFFAEATNVDDTSVSTLACAASVIAVGNLDVERERMNITSSQGPTRDGRNKPDVAAPGSGIIAARGFVPGDPWVAMTGTSMAAPYVTGVVALMLRAEPRLTAAQIEGILHRTSIPLPGGDFNWVNDAGFGRIDAGPAVLEASEAAKRTDRTKS